MNNNKYVISMKAIKYLFVTVFVSLLVACDESDNISITCTEITNLIAHSGEGRIQLEWNYPEGENTIRYMEISYWDPGESKEIKRTVSSYVDTFLVENTRKKYGEYTFVLQPFSQDFTPGDVYEVKATSLAAPVIYEFVSTEMALAAENIYVEGIMGSDPQSLLDGNLETFVNTDYTKPLGTIFWMDFVLPKGQDFLKFSYINRNNAAASFPAIIECWIKANKEDEWVLMETLNWKEEALPTKPLGKFISTEMKAPFNFKFFRFRVPQTHTGKPNFSLAEFRVFDVNYTFTDPEAEK